jgi:pimeloyl-ACP methyl ester carboxylesterase
LKLWRYFAQVPDKIYELDDLDRFRPILLIHGYQSNHISWNWMVHQLWEDGFRILFAMHLDDYKKGTEHNVRQLIKVVDYILKIEPIFEEIDVIAHSMGGLVSKEYIKLHNGAPNVRLFLSLGAPLTRVFRFWTVLAKLDYAQQSALDFRDFNKMDEINQTLTNEILYTLTQLHVIGHRWRYLGTDGLFKNKPVSDMINYYVSASHFSLNKNQDIYFLIQQILNRRYWFFKVRLLYIHNSEIEINDKIEDEFYELITRKKKINSRMSFMTEQTSLKDEILKFCFRFEVKKKHFERYPREEYIKIDFQEPYIPTDPLIIYSGMSPKGESLNLTINVLAPPGEITSRLIKELSLELDQERNIEYLTMKSTTSTFNEVIFQFAIYKYELA